MKVIREDHPIGRGDVRGIELTRRNLEVLLKKLDDPDSSRTLVMDYTYVKAVENDLHYGDREPGPMLVDGVIV